MAFLLQVIELRSEDLQQIVDVMRLASLFLLPKEELFEVCSLCIFRFFNQVFFLQSVSQIPQMLAVIFNRSWCQLTNFAVQNKL